MSPCFVYISSEGSYTTYHLGLHYLLMFYFWDARHNWVNDSNTTIVTHMMSNLKVE